MDNELALWKKAGKLAGEAREYGKTLLVEGANFLDIALKIEEFIAKKGGKPGFPVQMSINDIAAHYTPTPDDKNILKKGDVVKLDLGVHFDGYIGDTALTFEVGSNKHKEIIEASQKALEAAIKILKPGIKVCEIGEVVNKTITSYGFKPIKNLSGHKVDRYTLHSDISIPNYNNGDKTILKEGMVIAIEPFASSGAGLVKEGKGSTNYRIHNLKPVRDAIAKNVLDYINKEFKSLPFAKRYLTQKFPESKVNYALSYLIKNGIIYEYGQLPEKEEGSMVTQFEHTIYISDPIIILTK
jgi:methionyl aminopeptidase